MQHILSLPSFILVSILLLSGSTFAASESSGASYFIVGGSQPAKLTLADCFTLQATLVPGKKMHYAPVIVSKVFEIQKKRFGRAPETSKIVRCACGLVVGKDELVTQQAATLIASSMATWSMEEFVGNRYKDGQLFINVPYQPSSATMKRIINGNIKELHKLNRTLAVLMILESTVEKKEALKKSVDGTWGKCARITIPFNLIEKFKLIESVSGPYASVESQVSLLADYATTVPVFHQAQTLRFNPKRYARFVEQELGDSTH